MSNENFDINSLLDGTLDDLKDLPEFKPFPAGTHRVTVKLVDKTAPKDQINKHPGFELKMKLIETIELAGGSDTTLEVGAETGVLYLLDNEIGQGAFKNILKSAASHFGAKSNRELIADLQNTECLVVTKTRQNKDKTQTYTDIVELQVV
jgi:hypothetical protein